LNFGDFNGVAWRILEDLFPLSLSTKSNDTNLNSTLLIALQTAIKDFVLKLNDREANSKQLNVVLNDVLIAHPKCGFREIDQFTIKQSAPLSKLFITELESLSRKASIENVRKYALFLCDNWHDPANKFNAIARRTENGIKYDHPSVNMLAMWFRTASTERIRDLQLMRDKFGSDCYPTGNAPKVDPANPTPKPTGNPWNKGKGKDGKGGNSTSTNTKGIVGSQPNNATDGAKDHTELLALIKQQKAILDNYESTLNTIMNPPAAKKGGNQPSKPCDGCGRHVRPPDNHIQANCAF